MVSKTPSSSFNNPSYNTLTAGVTCVFGDVMYLLNTDSELYFADADAAATMPGVVICAGTGANGAPVLVITRGEITKSTWTWTVGDPIYVSTTGTTGNTMTQTAPSGSGDQIQIIGWAMSATKIMFNPSLMLVEVA